MVDEDDVRRGDASMKEKTDKTETAEKKNTKITYNRPH
jgi:hypothetical protein